jgi:dihydroorotase
MSNQQLRITKPDDWHLHLRDGDMLETVIADTARCFARAIVMPNLKPPVTTVAQAEAYRRRILAAVPEGMTFEPLMTLYLTENTSPDEIRRAKASDSIHAVKYYPAGATTNSDNGVQDLSKVDAVLETLQEVDLPLLLHGEVTDRDIDVFDREAVFIERHLQRINTQFPALRTVLEHVTTKDAVDYVLEASERVAATITVHHLLLNRNAIFDGGLRPHHYCLPLLKRETHRQALVNAATSGMPKFFLGTDSAPHPKNAKESGCGCAGIYSAPAAIELYAEVFAEVGALDRLEGFASFHGPDFYDLPRNDDGITLEAHAWPVPELISTGSDEILPLRAGTEVAWRLV